MKIREGTPFAGQAIIYTFYAAFAVILLIALLKISQ